MDKELEETMFYTAREGDTIDNIRWKFDLWASDELFVLNNKDPNEKWEIRKGDCIRVWREPATYICSECAVTNAYTDILWELRRALKEVRSNERINEALMELWAECKKKRRLYSPADRTLLQVVQDRDAMMPLICPLTHIKLRENEYLDCSVRGDDLGAKSEFVLRTGEGIRPLTVELDGSPESAWERVLLKVLSKQFFLAWHANYERYRIITDMRKFDTEADVDFDFRRVWAAIDESGRRRMMKNDFVPTVTLEDDCATVTYYIFSSFSGLVKQTDRVDMISGNILGETEEETIVEYCCGVYY